ncbi:MxaL protein [Caballeronia sp. BCC1704]|jgi:mxaK protein|uniref:MxaL protein n=1 Tax=Caballeronia sp. BCC1704 TaxID=2676300 RepID=UPI00158EC429|nr:MxaL protein [Caballeronia sp. BCC1704]
MKRAFFHAAFASATFCFAALALYDWSTLMYARHVAHAVSAVTAANSPARVKRSSNEVSEIQLARAVSLSKSGDFTGAQALFDTLVNEDNDQAVQIAALFDLGNMYLREAAGSDGAGPVRSLPTLELAKERYRSVLRVAPDDWDARYNLERALWLAPETQNDLETADVKKQTNVKVRGAQSEDLP